MHGTSVALPRSIHWPFVGSARQRCRLWRDANQPSDPSGGVFFWETPMSRLIASLRSGNWKALLACFLYFDTGFTTWVMFGPLAPFISKQISLTPIQAGFLVAVPVLAASILRVTLGNLFQSVDGRRLALFGIGLSAIPAFVLLLPIVPTYTLLLVLGVFLGVGGASFAIALPMAGSSYPPRVQGLV